MKSARPRSSASPRNHVRKLYKRRVNARRSARCRPAPCDYQRRKVSSSSGLSFCLNASPDRSTFHVLIQMPDPYMRTRHSLTCTVPTNSHTCARTRTRGISQEVYARFAICGRENGAVQSSAKTSVRSTDFSLFSRSISRGIEKNAHYASAGIMPSKSRLAPSHDLIARATKDGGVIKLDARGQLETWNCSAKLRREVEERRYLLTAYLREQRAAKFATEYGHSNWYLVYPYSTTTWPRSKRKNCQFDKMLGIMLGSKQ